MSFYISQVYVLTCSSFSAFFSLRRSSATCAALSRVSAGPVRCACGSPSTQLTSCVAASRGHSVLFVLAFGFVFVTSQAPCSSAAAAALRPVLTQHGGYWSSLSLLVCRLSVGSGRALLPHGQCLSQVALGDCPHHERTFLPSASWPVLALCVCVFLNPEVNFCFWQNSSVTN